MLGVMFIKYCIKVADVSLLPQILSAVSPRCSLLCTWDLGFHNSQDHAFRFTNGTSVCGGRCRNVHLQHMWRPL
jgi:hypothetical protein